MLLVSFAGLSSTDRRPARLMLNVGAPVADEWTPGSCCERFEWLQLEFSKSNTNRAGSPQ
jgi:hypothetical protein